MSFLLNEEQRQLSDSAIEFLAAQSPLSLQRQLRDSRAELGFEPTLWQQVVELGWPAAVFPESEGGLAVGYMGLGAIFEAMGRSVAALPLLSSVVLCGELVLRAGTESQRQALLPVLMDGTQRMALAIDEQGRHNPEKIKTTAHRMGDGWVLDGEKSFVIDAIGASWLIVVARTGESADDELGLFVVDTASAGVSLQATRLADSRNYARLQLTGVQVAAHMRLGDSDPQTLDAAQALAAALDRACRLEGAAGLQQGFEQGGFAGGGVACEGHVADVLRRMRHEPFLPG